MWRRFVKLLRYWRWIFWTSRRRTLDWPAFEKRLRGDANRTVPWKVVLLRDPCVYCGTYRDPTIEHVTPLRRRSHRQKQRDPTVENRVCACRRCNHLRGSTPLLLYLWLRHTGRRREDGGWRAGIYRGRARLYISPYIEPLKVKLGDVVRWKS